MTKNNTEKSVRQANPSAGGRKTAATWNQEDFKRLSEIVSQSLLSQYIETIQQAQKRIQESFAIPAMKWAEQLSQVAAATEEINKNLIASIEPVVKLLQEQQQIFAQLSETAFRIRERHERVCEAFRESGWCFAPSLDNIPDPSFDSATQSFYEGDREAITSLLMSYYGENNYERMELMVKSWGNNPLFTPRMQIIRDALEVHKEGKYTLTIPTLLPQTEGIAREFLLQQGINIPPEAGSSGRRLIPDAIQQGTENSYFDTTSANVLIWWVRNIAFVNTGTLEARGLNLRVLNRHNVLHGFQTNYASEEDSLRVFLTLDALFALKKIEEN